MDYGMYNIAALLLLPLLTAAGWFLLRRVLFRGGMAADKVNKGAAVLVSWQVCAAFCGFWLFGWLGNLYFTGKGEAGIAGMIFSALAGAWLVPLLAGALYLRGKLPAASGVWRAWGIILIPLLWAFLLLLWVWLPFVLFTV